MPELTVYSRPGCHLCEVLLEELVPLVRGRAAIRVCDIDQDSDLLARFNDAVPVVELNGTVICEYVLDRTRLERLLGPPG